MIKPILTAIAAVTISVSMLFAAFAATAKDPEFTGGDLLASYNAGGVSKDSATMYIMGVVDGMSIAGGICPPQDIAKGEYVQQVVYNLGAATETHSWRFDAAAFSAAIKAYPCGDPA